MIQLEREGDTLGVTRVEESEFYRCLPMNIGCFLILLRALAELTG